MAFADPDDVAFEIVRKRVKYLRLTVRPPLGEVRISAPMRTSARRIHEFVTSQLEWIRRQQQRIRTRKPPFVLTYTDGEIHRVWGVERRLEIVERDARPSVELHDDIIRLTVRPASSVAERKQLLARWYGTLLRESIPPLIAKWEPILEVSVARFFIRDMKTRWGSCTPRSRRIRLSTDLARKSPECLEYVVVHEMVHILEASHNRRFVRLMDRFLPEWRLRKQELNRRPTPPLG
ncbi:MAG: M48 family metallopeptidase [Acidobacteria bacterium]|nr:M48 family metallopeptidase [Acidobacteriota bacterium]